MVTVTSIDRIEKTQREAVKNSALILWKNGSTQEATLDPGSGGLLEIVVKVLRSPVPSDADDGKKGSSLCNIEAHKKDPTLAQTLSTRRKRKVEKPGSWQRETLYSSLKSSTMAVWTRCCTSWRTAGSARKPRQLTDC